MVRALVVGETGGAMGGTAPKYNLSGNYSCVSDDDAGNRAACGRCIFPVLVSVGT